MPPSTTIRAHKRYILTITQSSNQCSLNLTVKPTSFTKQVTITSIIFAILNSLLVVLTRYKLPLDRNAGNLVILAGFVFTLLILRRPSIESFTVYRNYGLQVTKVRGLLILPNALNDRWMALSKFIPRDQILDIVINEGFARGFQVIFYLAVIVKESKKLELLFPTTKLSLEDQKLIYNMSRGCLYTDKKRFHA